MTTELVWVQALALGGVIAALGWAMTAGPLRIFHRASREVVKFNVASLVAATLWAPWPLGEHLLASFQLAAGLMVALVGLQWLCLGLHRLYDLRESPAVSPLLWPLLFIVMAPAAWFDQSGAALHVAFFSAALWMLATTILQAYPLLMAQQGQLLARWSLVPLAFAGLLWVGGIGRSLVMLVFWFLGLVDEGAVQALQLMDPVLLALLLASWWVLNAAMVGLLMLGLVEKINDLTHEDEVTGALNLKSFVALLNDERERLVRDHQAHTLLLLEIDQLREFTRQLGFAAGDAALRHVTQVLGQRMRKTDRLGRSMHAELLMFLPLTQSPGATVVAERLQAAVRDSPFLWNGQAVSLSLSVGLAVRDTPDMDSETLVQRARHAVQRAVRDGGSRIRVGGTESQATEPSESGNAMDSA